MPKIAIITDSTAYLDTETVERCGIHVLPLKLHWDGDTFNDNVDIKPTEFYDRLSQSASLPTTSQPSIQEFYNLYKDVAREADAILAILISSGISGTVGSALSAAQEFDQVPVKVIDSHLTSAGLALIVQKAANLIENGGSLDAVSKRIEELASKVKTYFVVDTLKYLHKGGRIGGASRYLGTALNIKPILTLTDDGYIDALEKVRTKKKALQRVTRLAHKYCGKEEVVAGVVHANDPETAVVLEGIVGNSVRCKELHRYELSPVIGTHVGPGTVGLAFYIDK